MAPRPNMGAKNLNSLKLLVTMIVGALRLRVGFLKNDGVTAPKARRENVRGA